MKTKTMLILIVVLCMSIGVPLTFMATTIIDDTPPIIGDNQPTDGQVYQPNVLTHVRMWAKDLESMIDTTSAYYILDDGTPIKLDESPTQPKAYPYGAFFEKSGLPDPSIGVHTFKFQVKNNNGLLGELSGTFQIAGVLPPTLQGTWYINDIEITSPSQELRFTTKTLTFKFTKTKGIEDTGITCTVEWTGPTTETITLPNTEPSTWTKTHTFTNGGQYSMTLKANDGTQTITMSLFDMTLGDAWQPPKLQKSQIMLMTYIGIALITVGIIAFLVLRKH